MNTCKDCTHWIKREYMPGYGWCMGPHVFFLEEEDNEEGVPEEPRPDGIGIIGDWPTTGPDYGCTFFERDENRNP